MKLDKELLERITATAERKHSLECDGLTRVIAYILRSNGIEHRTMFGSLYRCSTRETVHPHFWIELDGHVLDFRARAWLGYTEAVPHGLFNPQNYEVTYSGSEVHIDVDKLRFNILMSS